VSILLELVVFVYCFFFLLSHARMETRIYGTLNIVILSKALTSVSKTVVLNKYYRGIKSQVNFATFFVLNAKMLESMTFECQRDSVTDRFLAEQHQLLQLEKRASRCARFYFTTKRCEHNFMHINHAHDLSKTDHFECEETRVGVCASFE